MRSLRLWLVGVALVLLGLTGCGAPQAVVPPPPDIRLEAAAADYGVVESCVQPYCEYVYHWSATVKNYGGTGQYRLKLELWPTGINPQPAVKYTTATSLEAGKTILLEGNEYTGYTRLWKIIFVVQQWNGSQYVDKGTKEVKW